MSRSRVSEVGCLYDDELPMPTDPFRGIAYPVPCAGPLAFQAGTDGCDWLCQQKVYGEIGGAQT